MSTDKTSDFKPQMRVRYVPMHAYGNITHPDCEDGTVSSVNMHFVFVKFDKQVAKFGWDGTTSQACQPSGLRLMQANYHSKENQE